MERRMANDNGFRCFVSETDEGRPVVEVHGYLDMATATEFAAVVAEARARSPHIALRMADVTFIDSTGLRVIATAVTHVNELGSVTIVDPSPAVRKLLDVTGMDRHVTVEIGCAHVAGKRANG